MVGFASAVLAGRAAVHDWSTATRSRCAASTSRACAGAASAPQRIAAVKQMHRLLYRDGPDARRRRAPRSRRCAGETPEAARRRRADDATSSPASTPRHRALSRRHGTASRGSRWSRARPRATCWPACCSTACERAGPSCSAAGIGGPQMAGAGLRGLVAARQAGGARLRRSAAPLPRDRRHPQPAAPSGCCASRPDAFIGVDAPDFNLDLEARLKARGIKTVHFVCPSIWAWRGERVEKIRAGRRPRAVHLPVRAGDLLRSTASPRPTSAIRWPSVIPLEPPRAAARAALGLADDDEVVAVLPGSRRSEIQYIAPPSASAPRALLRRRGPALRFVLPVVPGLRHADRAAARASTRRTCAIDAARRPVARGARGLRRRAGRQRHGDARGGALQAADGDRLRDELRSAGR